MTEQPIFNSGLCDALACASSSSKSQVRLPLSRAERGNIYQGAFHSWYPVLDTIESTRRRRASGLLDWGVQRGAYPVDKFWNGPELCSRRVYIFRIHPSCQKVRGKTRTRLCDRGEIDANATAERGGIAITNPGMTARKTAQVAGERLSRMSVKAASHESSFRRLLSDIHRWSTVV